MLAIVYTLAAVVWLLLPLVWDSFFNKPPEFVPVGLGGTPLTAGRSSFGARLSLFAYAISVFVFLGIVFAAQWAFLRPRPGWITRLATEGRPLRTSILAAAAMAMLLTTGFVAILFELPNWWEPLIDSNVGLAGIWAGMLIVWAIWAWIFAVYWKQGDRYTQLGRVIRALITGSLLEALVAIPVHIVVTRQRTDCYCYRGSYTALVCSGTVLLWAFGPGLVLLYLRERYRQERLIPHCKRCGYDLRASKEICPECGTPIPPRL